MDSIPDRLPSLRQLELLLTLAASDGIASAGAQLGMSPSATSHALRSLEAAIGAKVIDRNAPGVKLTHTGEQILPHARDVFTSLQLIRASASASEGLKTGLLRIGSHGASSSLNVLPPVLQAFKTRYPGVDIFVTERSDQEIERELVERRIEICVVALPKPDLDVLPLAVDELLAVLPTRHPLAKLQTVPARALAEHPLIMTHAGSQPIIMRMFDQVGVAPRVVHDLTQILSILEFVRRDQGISILASLVLPRDYEGVAYRPIHPTVKRSVALACLNEKRLSPAARAFWALTRNIVKSRKGFAFPPAGLSGSN